MRRLLIAAVIFASALAACSGSGGSGAAISNPPLTPTPTPTATPSTHPVVNGETVTFAVDDTVVDTPASAQPTMSSSSRTLTETVNANGMFNGHAAIDVHTVSTDGTVVGDNYLGFVATASGQNYVGYGNTLSDSVTQYTKMQIVPDTFIIDELPEVTGAHWSNSIALDTTTSSGPASNNTQETDVRNADGSETDTITFTDGIPADTTIDTFVTNTDGTAAITHQAASGNYQYTFGIPAQQGGAFVIPVTYHDVNGTQSYTVPDWYPGHALPTAPLASDMTTDVGLALPPAACSKGPQIQAVHTSRVFSLLSLFGDVDTLAEDLYFAPGRGFICGVDVRTDRFYDATGTGALTDTQTDTSVIALTSGVGIASRGRHANSFGLPGAAAFAFGSLQPRHNWVHRLPRKR